MPDRGNEKRAPAALVLTGGFMATKVAGGLLSGSPAWLADAGHRLTDTVALALACIAIRAARTPELARHIFRPPSAAGAGALVAEDADRDEVLFAIKIVLRTRFRLGHADVPLEGRCFRDLLAAGIPSIRLTKKTVQP